MTETVCTGPFQAHFVSACGALEAALRAAGTCRLLRDTRRAPDRAARWGIGYGSKRSGKDDEEDEEATAAACAAAAARVMLAASRTVRSGDALDLVMKLFPNSTEEEREREREGGGEGGGGGGRRGPQYTWLINALQPAEMKRLLVKAGPVVSVSVSPDKVVVTARDVFYVARAVEMSHHDLPLHEGGGGGGGEEEEAGGVGGRDEPPKPWAAVALVSIQELRPVFRDVPGGGGGGGGCRLELTSQSLGLDPGVPQSLLDAFLRERGPTPTVYAMNRY